MPDNIRNRRSMFMPHAMLRRCALAGLLLLAACAQPAAPFASSSVPPSAVAGTVTPTPVVAPTTTPLATPAPQPSSTPAPTPTLARVQAGLAPPTPLADTAIVERPLRGLRPLTDGRVKYRLAQWSPDGQWIAATPQDGPGLDLIDTARGTSLRLVSDTYVLEPLWADAATLIVPQTDANGDALVAYRIAASGVVSATLASMPGPIRAVGTGAGLTSFSADGGLYLVMDGDLQRVAELDALITAPVLAEDGVPWIGLTPLVLDLEQVQTQVLRLAPAGATLVSLSAAGEGLWLPRWAPRGGWLALTSIEGRIITVAPDGRTRHDLGPGDQPAWSPDGARLAYVGTNAGTQWISRDLYLVDRAGRGPRLRLTQVGDGEFISAPSWSPDGAQLAFVELDSGRIFVGALP